MSKVFKRGPATPQLNMTPLIDVTFQLIIFFMLVNNIIAEENVPMIVPDLDTPKTRELGEVDRITVNVAPMPFDMPTRVAGNPLNHAGEATRVKVGLQYYSLDDLDAIRAALASVRSANPKVEILLRADSAIYYREVQPIMDAISAAQITKVNVVALMPRTREKGASDP